MQCNSICYIQLFVLRLTCKLIITDMKNLAGMRDLKDYVTIIDTLLTHYVKSGEFAVNSKRERSDIVDGCQELKDRLIEAQKE